MTISAERSTDKERIWPVWVGSIDDLTRLAVLVEQATEVRRKALLTDYDEETKRQLAYVETSTPKLPIGSSKFAWLASENDLTEITKQNLRESIELNRRLERATLDRRLRMTTTMVDGDDTTSGEIKAVLAELDKRTVKSVTFSMDIYEDRAEVILDRKNRKSSEYGAKLIVKSPDLGWARQTFTQLSEEIAKGVPGYAWIRQRRGRFAVACGAGILPVLVVALMVLPSVPSKAQWIVWISGFYVAIMAVVIVSAPDWLFDWLAPRFEVTGEDSQSTGNRRIGAVVAPVVAIVIGIIVNRIYS